MLKLVVAYIDPDTFEPIRQDLAAHGITSISAIAAGGASEDRFAAPHYTGSAHTQHLAEKLRLECVVGASHLQSVKDTIFSHEGRRTFLFVMSVEEASPEDSVVADSSEALAGDSAIRPTSS
jgi:nitrogen regulatory protein PII